MNDFASLRHHIYRRHQNVVKRDLELADSILSDDLKREDSVKTLLAVKRLLIEPRIDVLEKILPAAAEDLFVRRHLADVLRNWRDQDEARWVLNRSGLESKILEDLLRDSGWSTKKEERSRHRWNTEGLEFNPTVFQPMFYGDPKKPGTGSSGGVGVLVLRLGDALGIAGNPAFTFTLTKESAGEPVLDIEVIGKHHWMGRYRINAIGSSPLEFLENRHLIAQSFRHTLDGLGMNPKTVHVRFLDDASLCVAREACQRGIPTAVTLTPDPHRSLVDSSGKLKKIERLEDLIVLHRIWAGDELYRICGGLMAIGQGSMSGELLDYFPQLIDVDNKTLDSVDEGVPTGDGKVEVNIPNLLRHGYSNSGIHQQFADRPILLSIGRLAAVKNMPALAEAWSKGLWETHNLVIIGGDLDNPTSEELRQIDFIHGFLRDTESHIAGRWIHLPGQSPDMIRQIESWLSKRSYLSLPDIYVAASLKEEFGLAILEAMGAGLICCAPQNGGAGAYMRSGINGFLIDTATAASLLREIRIVLDGLEHQLSRITAIQQAAKTTVEEKYSIEHMADQYRSFYKRLGKK